MEIFRERLREAVIEACEKRGMTQGELAEVLGLGRTRFKNYFSRATHMPVGTLREIIDELEIDANWVLGRDVSKEWPKEDPLQQIQSRLDTLIKKS